MMRPVPWFRCAQAISCGKGRGPVAPAGAYDGTFVQDYEYRAGTGELDECNGRQGVTPEFPNGTYYYVLTDAFPFIDIGVVIQTRASCVGPAVESWPTRRR